MSDAVSEAAADDGEQRAAAVTQRARPGSPARPARLTARRPIRQRYATAFGGCSPGQRVLSSPPRAGMRAPCPALPACPGTKGVAVIMWGRRPPVALSDREEPPLRLSHLPLRLTTGAFILNAGLSKRALTPEAATTLQDMARRAIPKVGGMSAPTFGKALSTGEMALGAALLNPFVSPTLAGAALVGFSGTLLRVWWVTPGMHEDGSPRPTQQGTALAKDVWMTGAGLALVLDGLTDGARRTARRTRRNARRRVKAARVALPVGP